VSLAILGLTVSMAQAATKSGKYKTQSAGQNTAAKNANSNAKSRRGANKSSGGSSGLTVERYDPVGKD
jgi:hypothetical protein